MNLEQSPNVMDYCRDSMPCLIKRGVYYSDELNRWLLPKEKLGVHLLPTREAYCEAMGLPYPFFKDTWELCAKEIYKVASVGMFHVVGNTFGHTGSTGHRT